MMRFTIASIKQQTMNLLFRILILTALAGTFLSSQSATFTATNTNDSGPGSLRQAIMDADNAAGQDQVNATAISGTIYLLSSISIISDVMIQGPGANQLTISGDSNNDGTPDIQVLFIAAGSTVRIDDISVGGGVDANGGGIFNFGNLTLNRCMIQNNAAVGGGGGLYNQGQMSIHNSTISNNSAVFGGGILNDGGGVLSIQNSTISGNTVDLNGGGLSSSGTSTVLSCTFTGNRANQGGGGIHSDSNLALHNSIVSNNTAPTDPEISGAISTQSLNLVGIPAGGTIGQILNTNLANNGGPTLTHALPPGSPAINGGNNAFVPLDHLDSDTDSNTAETTPFDQRGQGFERVLAGTIDLGAFESSSAPSQTVSLTATDATAGEHQGSLNTGTFQITRSSASGTLTVDLKINASSTASDSDHNLASTLNITFTDGINQIPLSLIPKDDTIAESNETLQLDLTPSPNYAVNTSSSSATITIEANDFGVTNTNDSGEGSLRQAMLNANQLGGNPTIDLSKLSGTISLQSELQATKSMTIKGPSSGNGIALSGDSDGDGHGNVRVLHVVKNATVGMHGLSIAKGSTGSGGGILNEGSLTLVNLTLNDNSAVLGGGIQNYGTLAIHNSTFSGNHATTFGGAIMQAVGSCTLQNCTITGNISTNKGGGIYVLLGSIEIDNSIIAGNEDIPASPDDPNLFSNTSYSGSHNIIGIPGNKTIHDILNTKLARNGGSTLTHALAKSSPAINAGNSIRIPKDMFDLDGDGNTSELIPFDQRGQNFDRVEGNAVDIGAVEASITVSISVIDPTAGEHLGVLDEATFRVNRNFTKGGLNIPLKTSPSSTTSMSDHNIAGSFFVSMADGVGSVDIVLTPIDDAWAEPDEILKLDLQTSLDYKIDPNKASASATILANDFGVNQIFDAGEGTLRQAILNANALGGNPTIDASGINGTIQLLSTLEITKDLSIRGPGADQLTISGDQSGNMIAGPGDVRILEIAGGVNMRLSDVSLTHGYADDGGAIRNAGHLSILNSSFDDSAASRRGGGIFNETGARLLIQNSTLSKNSSMQDGGGIYNLGDLSIQNSTFSGNNTTSSRGGGIYSSGTLSVQNVTLTGNTAVKSGGGIENAGGTLTIDNSLVVHNRAPSGTEVSGPMSNQSHSIVGIPSGMTIHNILNPTLSNNGGPTRTHALLTGSPAIDAGDNALLPSDTLDIDGDGNTTESLPFDQRGKGFTRTVAGTTDIGAIELTPTISIIASDASAGEHLGKVDTATFQITRDYTSGALSVPLTINFLSTAAPTDHNLASHFSVNFADGDRTAEVILTPKNDTIAEGDETVQLDLLPHSALLIDTTKKSATAVITANDFGVTNSRDAGEGTLRQAILNANQLGGNPTIDLTGFVNETIVLQSTIFIDGNMTIKAHVNVRVSGDKNLNNKHDAADVQALFIRSGSNVEIIGLSIINGYSSTDGGGIHNEGNLKLNDVFMNNCIATGSGGCIYNAGSLNLHLASFQVNSAPTGGGIFNTGTINATRSDFIGNQATITYGGFLHNEPKAVSNFERCIVSSNSAALDGGCISSLGNLVMKNCFIGNNNSKGGNGGGIRNIGDLTVVSSTFSKNKSNLRGGAIHNLSKSLIINSAFIENETHYGGGLHNEGTVDIWNTTFSGNKVVGLGGAIESTKGSLSLINATIANNTAMGISGGGIFNTASLSVFNSLIINNIADSKVDNVAGTFSFQSSIIGIPPGKTIKDYMNPVLTSYTGSKWTTPWIHPLVPGSPAINAGSTAHLPTDKLDLDGDGNTTEPIPFEQRGVGFARDSKGGVDMGAVEFSPTVSIVTTDSKAGEHLGKVDSGFFDISRDTDSGSLTVELEIDPSSTASSSDHSLKNLIQVHFTQGQRIKTVKLTPTDDLLAEPNETVQLIIKDSTQYLRQSNQSFATVTIMANDFGVINTHDSGEGTLRQAIINANDLGGNPTIDLLNISGTIDLQSTLSFTKSMQIQGPGSDKLTLSGDKNKDNKRDPGDIQIMSIGTAAKVNLSGMTLSKGNGTAGAAGIDNKGNLQLHRMVFRDNHSHITGCIYNFGILLMDQCIMNENSSTKGSAIFNMRTLTIRNSLFHKNISGEFGGVLYQFEGSSAIINSTLSENTATVGGVIYQGQAGPGTGGTIQLENSTISGNTATRFGGGIYSEGKIVIKNCTLTGNKAGSTGGGIWNDGKSILVQPNGHLTVHNNIIANNTAQMDPDIHGVIHDNRNNMIGIPSGKNITDILNPKLSDNGGYTPTHALVSRSPAIHGGNNALLPKDTLDMDGDGNTTELIPFDQRGKPFARIAGNKVDLGAVEFVPTVSIVTVDDQAGEHLGAIDTATYRVTRSDTLGTLNVVLSTHPSSTTSRGDHDVAGYFFVSLANGVSHVDVVLTPTDDAWAEPDELVRLDLEPSPDYHISQTSKSASITIAANDFGVNQVFDSGQGTLRQAIINANNLGGDPTIDIKGLIGGISLRSTLEIRQDMSIVGAGSDRLLISGDRNNNTIADPADVRILDIGAGVNVLLSGLTVMNGYADDGASIRNMGTLTVRDTIIRNSSAHNRGGGIFNDNGATLRVINSTLNGNDALQDGGGIFNAGTLMVQNSTFYRNDTSSARGGGIFNSGNTTIQNTTMTLNTAVNSGGGVANIGGTLVAHNSIIAGNRATTDGEISGGITNGSHNLIGIPMGLRLNSILNTSLTYNGGPTPTQLLTPNSPAIDGGDNSLIPLDTLDMDNDGNTTEPLPFDQRGSGHGRILGSFVDMGAVEMTPTKQMPTAKSQTLTLKEDSIATIQVVDGTEIENNWRAIILSLPANGELFQTSDGINIGTVIKTVPTTVSDNQNRVIFQPALNEFGDNYGDFSFALTDGDSSSASGSITIHVSPVNDAPIVVPVSDLRIDSESSFEVTLELSDVDHTAEEISLEITNNFEDLIDAGTITIEGRGGTRKLIFPAQANGRSGIVGITIRAIDPLGASHEETFQIQILDPKRPSNPPITIRLEKPKSVGEKPSLILSWMGNQKVLVSDNILGPYLPLENVASPHTINTQEGSLYYMIQDAGD